MWRGVPFAAAPVGTGRFRPPVPHEPWEGARATTDYGPSSISTDVPGLVLPSADEGAAESEDCLYLNVWSPLGNSAPRPVLVWIHGGSFVFGSGTNYDGAWLAAHGDVVVVTFNYRLGALGFLDLATIGGPAYEGAVNVGLLDQVAALQWVKDNIAAFGGDPDCVTVIGQASGAMCIGALLSMPATTGLIHRAIMQSGAADRVQSRWRSRAVAVRLLNALNIDYREASRLQDLPIEVLRSAAGIVMAHADDAELEGEPFLPVVDGAAIPRHPLAGLVDGAAAQVPVLISVCRQEANLFLAIAPEGPEGFLHAKELHAKSWYGDVAWRRLSEVYRETAAEPDQGRSDLLTALMFGMPAIRTAEAADRGGGQVWMMRFDHTLGRAPFDRLGACHGADLPFTWTDLSPDGESDSSEALRPEDRRVAQTMQDLFLSFARTGNPAIAAVPEWPSYQPGRRAVMLVGTETEVQLDPSPERRGAWQGLPLPLTLNLRRGSRSRS